MVHQQEDQQLEAIKKSNGTLDNDIISEPMNSRAEVLCDNDPTCASMVELLDFFAPLDEYTLILITHGSLPLFVGSITYAYLNTANVTHYDSSKNQNNESKKRDPLSDYPKTVSDCPKRVSDYTKRPPADYPKMPLPDDGVSNINAEVSLDKYFERVTPLTKKLQQRFLEESTLQNASQQ